MQQALPPPQAQVTDADISTGARRDAPAAATTVPIKGVLNEAVVPSAEKSASFSHQTLEKRMKTSKNRGEDKHKFHSREDKRKKHEDKVKRAQFAATANDFDMAIF